MHSKERGGPPMNETDMISELRSENRKLKDNNDMLNNIIAQMQVTLNRLILRYITDEKGKA
jgi:hypothetical protein